MAIKSAVYTAHAHTTGGRTGTSATDDGRLSVTLDTPKAMGGNDGPGTNPSSCLPPAIPPASSAP